MSHLVSKLILLIRNDGLPDPEREYRALAPERQHLFDLAWPPERLLVEVHGGVWGNEKRGRHVRGQGFIDDREKMNLAQLAGWRVLEVCAAHIDDGRAVEWIREGLGCSNCSR